MSRQKCTLITGASGEMGHGLIDQLATRGSHTFITLDLKPLEATLSAKVHQQYTGDILNTQLLDQINSRYEVTQVFHLAALLSTSSEFSPALAHKVNVEGTLNLLEFAQKQGEWRGKPVVFFYPSSIAAYGIPSLEIKAQTKPVQETEFNFPTTMYGANKLYCEHLGRYYDKHYKQLAAESQSGKVDFRCIRFPGLISAITVPSGGTSDFAPEMIHAAAQQHPYDCFVRPDARIPFMAMPDAVDAVLKLVAAPKAELSQSVYNIGAFAPSAAEVEAIVRRAFPNAIITYELDAQRQAIVDSWPADVDDSAARRDWHHAPRYDFSHAFDDYLIPQIRARYHIEQ